MTKTNVRIWIWVQNNHILKAISNPDTGTLTIYNEIDEIILRRTGLTKQQIKRIEDYLTTNGLKKIDENKEPFTYL